ncbi:hypothetical protein EDD59_12411 [Muricomes intestini]|uniref:CAAX prenyl protease 2/Lysostaphin resistance protein A-like domain-containing protein n=1 Tax=Muricomes intestini TaxID=1796634 RepID=A0A4R3K295_9FIRM|nr:type II CAAX endopeptidase family protein [Muricomes intestini]TCS76395.1 hypothetical protein EDD59_12411 [Muricomes intestini]
MKKLAATVLRTSMFFIGWVLLVELFPIPNYENAAIWRFWAELIPFLCVVVFTAIFWLIDKRKIGLCLVSKPIKNSIAGLIISAIWLGAVTAVLMICGVMKINDYKAIPMLWLWLISALINTVMQELLVRGYLYQMIKSNYNMLAAIIVTTALFTFMHGGAFEAGIISVLNVLSMSVLMTIVLEYTQSLIAPIIMHFIWNAVGAIILGGVSLADDYPYLFSTEFKGNGLLTGGVSKIEGSIVVLIINIVLIAGFCVFSRRADSSVTKHYL